MTACARAKKFRCGSLQRNQTPENAAPGVQTQAYSGIFGS